LLLQQFGEPLERGVQPDMVVDLPHLGGGDLELGPPLAILVVPIRDDRIQAVVAAVELDHDQDPALRRGRSILSEGARGAGQEHRDRRATGQEPGRAEAQAEHRAASRVHGHGDLPS
jgi:hypothetical protein